MRKKKLALRIVTIIGLAVVVAFGIVQVNAAVHVTHPDCDNCPSIVYDPFLNRTCYLIPDSCVNDCSYWCVYGTPIVP